MIHRFLSLLMLALLVLPLSSCAHQAGGAKPGGGFFSKVPKTHKTHPDFDEEIRKISKCVLAAPEMKIYNMSTGDVTELREDWSGQGEAAVAKALVEQMEKKGVHLQVKDVQDETLKKELDQVYSLFKAVDLAAKMHAYKESPWIFPDKADYFEYSLGSMENLLAALDADALALFFGADHISSTGRKVLMATSAITGLITGHQVLPGTTSASLALVNAQGEILWYNFSLSRGSLDLREPESAAELAGNLAHYFPEQ